MPFTIVAIHGISIIIMVVNINVVLEGCGIAVIQISDAVFLSTFGINAAISTH